MKRLSNEQLYFSLASFPLFAHVRFAEFGFCLDVVAPLKLRLVSDLSENDFNRNKLSELIKFIIGTFLTLALRSKIGKRGSKFNFEI